MNRPHGILIDYGGTLVEEVEFDTRAATGRLLTHAIEPLTWRGSSSAPNRVTREVARRRDEFHIETPGTALTRLPILYGWCARRLTAQLDNAFRCSARQVSSILLRRSRCA